MDDGRRDVHLRPARSASGLDRKITVFHRWCREHNVAVLDEYRHIPQPRHHQADLRVRVPNLEVAAAMGGLPEVYSVEWPPKPQLGPIAPLSIIVEVASAQTIEDGRNYDYDGNSEGAEQGQSRPPQGQHWTLEGTWGKEE